MTQCNFWDPPGLAQSHGTTSAVKKLSRAGSRNFGLVCLIILVKDVVGSMVGPKNSSPSVQVPDPKEVTFVRLACNTQIRSNKPN